MLGWHWLNKDTRKRNLTNAVLWSSLYSVSGGTTSIHISTNRISLPPQLQQLTGVCNLWPMRWEDRDANTRALLDACIVLHASSHLHPGWKLLQQAVEAISDGLQTTPWSAVKWKSAGCKTANCARMLLITRHWAAVFGSWDFTQQSESIVHARVHMTLSYSPQPAYSATTAAPKSMSTQILLKAITTRLISLCSAIWYNLNTFHIK